MPKKLHKSKNRTKKNGSKRRHYKKKSCITRKGRGGGCGCGGLKALGGSAYLNVVPQYSYYNYNGDLQNDPQNPSYINDTRFMGDYSRSSGGKRNCKSRKGRKIRGGSNFFSNLYSQLANSGSGMNYINSFDVVNGINNQTALVTGSGTGANGAVTAQPVIDTPYGFQNTPLA